ncbi:hypothetical protein [Gluconacetobacter asukensis]|uniref:Uncharacterized protein n=1 Tax=Gluconacetobacter asukensis TaxID=1017181 RepID=A0A7W4NZC1_9PROT|nr:hypothetical protein [Gluconacetobacter asukensis]MBB2171851.1 hypothetical protein [Gluconacetobacter asukensis]
MSVQPVALMPAQAVPDAAAALNTAPSGLPMTLSCLVCCMPRCVSVLTGLSASYAMSARKAPEIMAG